MLTTLDAKASALMRLNGVLIAAAAFLLGLFHRQGGSILSTTSFDAVLIIVCALLSAVSITFCLFVVNVSWSFLGKVTKKDSTFEFANEIKCLDEASNFRQRAYRWAWNISLIASFGFLIEFVWQAAYVIYIFLLRVMHHGTKKRNPAPQFRETGAEATSGAF